MKISFILISIYFLQKNQPYKHTNMYTMYFMSGLYDKFNFYSPQSSGIVA